MGEGGVEMDAPTIIASLGLETAAPIIASEGVGGRRRRSSMTPVATATPRVSEAQIENDSPEAAHHERHLQERLFPGRRRPNVQSDDAGLHAATRLSISCVSKELKMNIGR